VWECSHVGGERFAANVLVLPTGLLYGRVLPFAASQFIAAAERREVLTPMLRGRVGMVPAAQAALAFAYEQLALRQVDDVRVDQVRRQDGGPIAVELTTPRGPVEVTVAVERGGPDLLTCHADAASRFLIHRPVGLHRR
jgi:hypothetical protein